MSEQPKSMKKQLSSLRKQITANKRTELRNPTPSPMNWRADGEDHINVWEHASSDLGKLLAHSSRHEFKHQYFGKFCSMESFWHYIQSAEKDDRIRIMRGPALRTFVKKLEMVKVTNFRAIIMDSNWQRIRQHKDWMQRIAESTLPFDCYYINSMTEQRVRPTFYKWLVMGFEEIRSAIKEEREPVFDFLLDHADSEIYKYVLPKLTKPILSDEQAANIMKHLEEEVGA